MPIPNSRKDDPYFEPLKGLKMDANTELILGCVHEFDNVGTKERMGLAESILGGSSFGVSTECGFGRMSVEQIESVLEVMRDFADFADDSGKEQNPPRK